MIPSSNTRIGPGARSGCFLVVLELVHVLLLLGLFWLIWKTG